MLPVVSILRDLFLWLTDKRALSFASQRRLSNFSTHDGRVYQPGTPLTGITQPGCSYAFTLVLTGWYVFNWQTVLPGSEWRYLVMRITRAG